MTPNRPVVACQGGWCELREHCKHYHSVARFGHPFDRLCEDGDSDAFLPIRPEHESAPEPREQVIS